MVSISNNDKCYSYKKIAWMMAVVIIVGVVTVACTKPRPIAQVPITVKAQLPAEMTLVTNEQQITTQSPPSIESFELALGKVITRELKGGESHSYSIAMEAGQYLQAVVEQQGIDVVVMIYEPSGKKVYEMDSPNGAQGPEPVKLVADTPGIYNLEVKSLEKDAQLGQYKVKVEEQRAATEQDRELMEAELLTAEITQLTAASAYDKAIPLAQRVLAIKEKVLGLEHIDVATSLKNLAKMYQAKGDYIKAEPLYQRLLAIREKVLGINHLDVALSLNNLASLYQAKGDYNKAEPFYQRSLAIYEKMLGGDHPDVATSLNNLALLYNDKGDYIKAEPLYQRSLAIYEKVLGADHPDVASSLNSLAVLYAAKGDYIKAEPFLQRSLAIRERVLGAEHLDVASSLNNLAQLCQAKGDYIKAEPLLQRSLAIKEKVLGANHPDVATLLNNLTVLYQAKGDWKQTIDYQVKANATRERELLHNLVSGSEQQKLLYLNKVPGELHHTLSLHLQSAPNEIEAARLALETLLQRKARILDVMTDTIAILRRRADSEDQKLFDELAQASSLFSTRVLKGPGKQDSEQYKAELKALEKRVEDLQAELSKRSAEFRDQLQPITLNSVQQAIPDNSALVEFVVYRPYDAKTGKFSAPHYAVYVLSHNGDPLWAELGQAIAIDKTISDLRAVLRDKNSNVKQDVKPIAQVLDQLVMKPVRNLVGANQHLFISPDGALNLIPFEALVDEQGKYLLEDYEISYLTSGRDLLRLQNKMESKEQPLVMADPDYGQGNGPVLLGKKYRPLDKLPASAKEAVQIQAEFPDAQVYTGTQATKSVLQSVNRPYILHIATHGYFLEDTPQALLAGNDSRILVRDDELNKPKPAELEKLRLSNGLLHSWLLFAGANNGAEQDSTMTALEVTGLNLFGTKLVVLSACDTGIGEVHNGEGVYGLRRALVLAGSETQLMSLWSVSDLGTQELMIAYYRELKKGAGRSAGLRKVRLEMLRSKQRSHPYYWASFIQSGEWANLQGER